MKIFSPYKLLLCLTFCLGPVIGRAQLTVSGAKTPTELVQDVLLGTGVTVSNVSYTGDVLARGEFDGTSANIGFNAGVLLTSGSITNAIGPNNSPSRSRNNGEPGDTDINTIISPTNSRDAAVLEFDFKVAADTVFFDYVFASEEYPEFAPPNSSAFNDAFAFLLSGPNPSGGNYVNLNIALIPGTTTPVSINNVNAVTNNTFYTNNGNGFQAPFNSSSFYVQYDGFTVPLTAIAAVVPCATYHIKLVVADAADFVYDSGVFLEANSFGANVTNPTIDFISTAPACHGDSVNFLNLGSSSTPGILYSWDFGAGASPATSTAENPNNVVYSSPGLKLVTLEMDVNCGDTTLTLSKGITIDEKPAPAFTHNAPQCEGQPINFTYTGTTGSNWTYSWDFGSGASPQTASSQNPVGVVYNSPGTKTITLNVTNGNCVENFTQTIVINDRPSASFSNTGPVGIGYGVDFTNTGTTGATYSWNFGANSSPGSSTSENPTGITYSTNGGKTVSLITSNATCADTFVDYLNILVTPSPSFTSNAPQPVGFPLIFNYTGNTGNNFTFNWDFGSGAMPATSSSSTPPSVYYSTPGLKTITLTVTNGSIVITITQTITIDQPPQSFFTSTAPNCEGIGIDFQANGQSGMTYSWDFGIGASPATATSQNPLSIVYSSPGFKTVRLISSLGGSTDTTESTIYIIPQPKPIFTHNGPQCQGSAMNFNYTGNTGSGWIFNWDFGNASNPNFSSASSPQNIVYGSAGAKIVQLSVTNGICSEVDSQLININPTPVSGMANLQAACTGDSLFFTNTGSAGLVYNWLFGQGSNPPTSTAENPPAVVYNSSGLKSIRQVISQGSCSDTSYQILSLIQRPTSSFGHNGPKCEGSPVTFTNLGSVNSNWTYNWDFGSDAQPSNSYVVSPSDVYYGKNGTVNISLTITNQFCSASDTQLLLIDSTPAPTIYTTTPSCQGDTFVVTGSGWLPNAIVSFSSASVSHDALTGKTVSNEIGIHKVKVLVSLGQCTDSAETSYTIHKKPLALFTSTAPVCSGELVGFFNGGSNNTNRWNYRWDFGTSALPVSSSAENPEGVRFTRGGDMPVNLKVWDSHCQATFDTLIRIDFRPEARAGTDTILCSNECARIGSAPAAGLSYQWFPASNLDSATNSNPLACPSAEFSQFILTATVDSTGCTSNDTVLLTMLTSALADAGSDVEICLGKEAQLGSGLIKGQTYSWSPGAGLSDSTVSSPMASPLETTTYKLLASYKDCSEIEDQVVVTVRKTVADAGEDVTLGQGESVELKGSGGVAYQWSPEVFLSHPLISNPICSPEVSTTYVLTVTDIFNCEGSDTIQVTVVESELFIPTAFTPGRAENNVFKVYGEFFSNFEMSIYNRHGTLVYYSKNFYQSWDGTNMQDGSVQPSGAYIYSITGNSKNGVVNERGMVNLLR
ncbi:MAG: choice-of-anchor L domain-containing protein [Vicingaceae bacterium]